MGVTVVGGVVMFIKQTLGLFRLLIIGLGIHLLSTLYLLHISFYAISMLVNLNWKKYIVVNKKVFGPIESWDLTRCYFLSIKSKD